MLSFSTPPRSYPSRSFHPSSSSLSFSHGEFEIVASSLPSILTSSIQTNSKDLLLGGMLTTLSAGVPSVPLHHESSALIQNNPTTLLSSDVWNFDASFWEPIKLSTLAGLSTCIGASVAFVVGVPDDGNNGAKSGMNDNGPPGSRGGAGVVGPELLAFSLALAGSVMITVVIVSIIPECLMIGDATMIEGSSETLDILGNLISSQLLLHRTIGFAVGWGTYALLSKWLAVLPEEDEWSDMLAGGGSAIPFSLAPVNEFGVASLADSRVDNSIPSYSTMSEAANTAEYKSKQSRSWWLTILLFLSLLLHNFPEGLAVAFSAASSATPQPVSSSIVMATPATETMMLNPSPINPITSGTISFHEKSDPNELIITPHPSVTSTIVLSSPSSEPSATPQKPATSSTSSLASIVTLSIALHNIPEGIAIAIPCMAARPDQPFLAFGLASLSGLAEPIGAFIGLMVLRLRGLHATAGNGLEGSATLANGQDMGDALAFVAGIMLAVAVFELLPEAGRQRKECDSSDSFILGIVIGVGVMVLTELYVGG